MRFADIEFFTVFLLILLFLEVVSDNQPSIPDPSNLSVVFPAFCVLSRALPQPYFDNWFIFSNNQLWGYVNFCLFLVSNFIISLDFITFLLPK